MVLAALGRSDCSALDGVYRGLLFEEVSDVVRSGTSGSLFEKTNVIGSLVMPVVAGDIINGTAVLSVFDMNSDLMLFLSVVNPTIFGVEFKPLVPTLFLEVLKSGVVITSIGVVLCAVVLNVGVVSPVSILGGWYLVLCSSITMGSGGLVVLSFLGLICAGSLLWDFILR